MFVAEVIETKTAYKPNQKDDDGNQLPLLENKIRKMVREELSTTFKKSKKYIDWDI